MTSAALREALSQWVRHPREMALANAAGFLAVFLPAALLPSAPGILQWGALALLMGWAWLVFSALCAAAVQLSSGTLRPWRSTWTWWAAAWPERSAAFAVAAVAAAWISVAVRFYLDHPFSPWLVWGVVALLGAFGTWLALALLLSLGVAAEGGRPWRAVWRTSGLLPLAYAPSALAAAAVFLAALGVPVLWIGLRHWSARLWMVPLLLSPFFTLAFLAAYLTALVRGMFDHAQGLKPRQTGSLRELWMPWR